MEEDRKENKIELFQSGAANVERRHAEGLKPYEVIEADEAPDLRASWRILRERRWTVLGIFFVVFVMALIATLKEKPIYRATALLEIERENPSIITAKDLFQLESVSDTYLETQYKVLHSETLARQVIAQLHLDRLDEINQPPPWWHRGKKAGPKDARAGQQFATAGSYPSNPDAAENALGHFSAALTVTPIHRSRLVRVSFESHDPALAAKVVNTLASDYIQQNLELRWDATQRASEWLSEQLEGVKARLEKSEDALDGYAQRNGLLYLESGNGNSENIVDQRLRQLQDELTKAQADRYAKESLYRLIGAGDYDSLPGVQDKLMQDLTNRLAELEQQKAALTPTFTDDYPKVKQVQSEIDKVQKILTQQRKMAAQRIADDYLAAVRREGLVRKAFEEQRKQANEVTAKSVQYNILKREVDTNKQLYEGLLGRLKEAGVSAGLKATNIRIVDAADPPPRPAKPNVLLNLSLALAVGLALGVGAAFLQEHLDNTLKSSEDVQQYLQLPTLGGIPAAASLNGHRGVYALYERGRTLARGGNGSAAKLGDGWFRIDNLPPQYSPLGEAFCGLRTSLLLSTAERPPRSLLITSAQPGEGKTTIASNLAISLVQLGQRVLLIDADLRRPCIHRLFHGQGSIGLVSCLAGQQDWRAVVQRTEIAGLDVLCCGPIPPAPAELLSSDRMRMLLGETVAAYEAVLLDSPPLLNFADARILASMVEGVVLVVKGGATPRELAERAYAYTQSVGGNLIGVVLNNVDARADRYYYNYYGNYYEDQKKKEEGQEVKETRAEG